MVISPLYTSKALMAPSKVLLIDDDPTLLEVFPQTLRMLIADVEVETIESASGALRRLDEAQFDAIISDISMPQMNGLTLVAEIKKRGITTPILLISASPTMVERALKSGVFAVIPKPFNRLFIKKVLVRALRYGPAWQRLRYTQEACTAQLQAIRVFQKTVEARIVANQLLLHQNRASRTISIGIQPSVPM
jgi:DNA-binding NtrC family response regulator